MDGGAGRGDTEGLDALRGPEPLTHVRPLRERLSGRAVVLVGLMGAGKTTVGKRLAGQIGLPFRDADAEIEIAAGMSITDIFATYGEPAFRDGEARVIARLLRERPLVLATGGGAFMSAETRGRIAEAGLSVWLKADLQTLVGRVRRRHHRPLLANADPTATMARLMELREPIYACADIVVESRDSAYDRAVRDIVEGLDRALARAELSGS